MTRFAIDAPIALRLIRGNEVVSAEHQLVAPASIRSQVMSSLYREVREGMLDEKAGRQQLNGLAELKMRLLGDRVSRATAWKIAERLGWDDIYDAEYLAVASLQADALVTEDEALRTAATGIVAIAEWADLVS
ncbi:MAG: hypothetical protein JWO10_1056 [Microbacteriaceae bacterium]|nr:hypothetical protein [Microbacteriaceae bacterium]